MTSATSAFPLDAAFFERSALEVAADLVGVGLEVAGVGGVIVETEAYLPDDPASHSFGGQSLRNRSMFGPPGVAYVYRSYGIHWCLNFVCLPASAVLIRALAPQSGIDTMRRRRGGVADRLLCSGPGRLCQALAIDGTSDGLPLTTAPFRLTSHGEQIPLLVGPRIGITKAADLPWRFGLQGSLFLSRRF
ncbi:DNA-3-methyladenine glycosylase [Sinorhizobium sp. BG8]|uniref:DNA-3-methyladenine glycosylase n=1 Tax=Sinorhizobium sp. BG8 TaxID=2613773 RepID=UPI00193D91AB|nr:DNA-3-methyladenine glycosylase [Sinorhizobium sp. BG8]QRM55822.1 DNA-3-methyladenine glycosylase [Sinorhizobium sp. BG8]